MLGNIKLVGGLLARGMLAAKAPFFVKKSTSTKNMPRSTQCIVYYVHEWLVHMVNLGRYTIEYLGISWMWLEVRGFIYGSLHVGWIFDENLTN